MSSHAVFNALTYVQHQIVSNENRASLKALSTFAGFIRNSSNDIELEERLITKESAMLESYCVLEQWRFADRVSITTNIKVKEGNMAPGFLFTPFIEQVLLSVLKLESKEIKIEIDIISDQLTATINQNIDLLPIESLSEEQKRRRILFEERVQFLKDQWILQVKTSGNQWQLNFKPNK